jgi:hypothetical protein
VINQDKVAPHDAIMRIATHLNVQAARLEHGEAASVAVRTMRILDEMLSRHLGARDDDEQTDVGATALRDAWSQYVSFWTEDRITRQPRDFGQITQAMLDAVMERIRVQAAAAAASRPY